ncbi:hypothetical protein QNI19_24650 [Cytophagaceae bacterium DM2B3-1]|uniref:Uncharacterized protein n=1 Tax=Xanthocytophaga flava TaxID=3048013 RepID=A0AAE3QP05_9BACT|nr:hypothetical protein [Xanthocytophaga flavus]MDJ1482862.1 hypothetical protein [Xanthocytophaga flavus]MDJ1496150.1 hypothetical protein [Xanthocytophaga flavus]
MQIQETPEYQLIKTLYGDRKATRSQVPLLNHIDEGLQILVWEQAELTTQRAYCLHPVFQGDDSLLENYTNVSLDNLDNRTILLAMEYRNIANQYLSTRIITQLEEIRLSPLKEVNQMLVADKIQNRKDFECYHQHSHIRSKELTIYFANWLRRLGISEEKYHNYCQKL